MTRWKPTYTRLLAVVLGLVLIVQAFLFSMQGMGQSNFGDVRDMVRQDAENGRIAAELSTMTGVAREEILALKTDERTWNDVIEQLQDREPEATDRADRQQRLAESGLDEDWTARMQDEGFSEEAITETRMAVERVAYQLREIVREEPGTSIETPTVRSEEEDDDQQAYQALAEAFDPDKAVYLSLKLASAFDGRKAVLNEYLFTLQAELDLMLYIEDKERYEEEKQEKGALLAPDDVITLQDIEERMLETLRQDASETEDATDLHPTGDAENEATGGMETESPLPEGPRMKPEDVKPPNPGKALRQEMNSINPITP